VIKQASRSTLSPTLATPPSPYQLGIRFSHILLRESSASKSNFCNDFSKLSRRGFDTEHFNARDAAIRERRAVYAFKFSFSLLFVSIWKHLFAYFVHLFNIYCDGKTKTSLILKTLNACLHNIPRTYETQWSAIYIRK
jgi:hypothetical protein